MIAEYSLVKIRKYVFFYKKIMPTLAHILPHFIVNLNIFMEINYIIITGTIFPLMVFIISEYVEYLISYVKFTIFSAK